METMRAEFERLRTTFPNTPTALELKLASWRACDGYPNEYEAYIAPAIFGRGQTPKEAVDRAIEKRKEVMEKGEKAES